jgi:hypothetical protein
MSVYFHNHARRTKLDLKRKYCWNDCFLQDFFTWIIKSDGIELWHKKQVWKQNILRKFMFRNCRSNAVVCRTNLKTNSYMSLLFYMCFFFTNSPNCVKAVSLHFFSVLFFETIDSSIVCMFEYCLSGFVNHLFIF